MLTTKTIKQSNKTSEAAVSWPDLTKYAKLIQETHYANENKLKSYQKNRQQITLLSILEI